jgi:sugar-specific transcriptional regulator TrmB
MKQSLLRLLGLNEKEIRVYSAVLKEKRLAPAALAVRVGIKRTTAYSIARGLVEKGLLVEDGTKRLRIFTLPSPADITGIIVDEKKRLVEREHTLKDFAEELAQNAAETFYPVPKIRFIEEEKIEKFLYQETPIWHRAIENLRVYPNRSILYG